jgi:hypothetical protein
MKIDLNFLLEVDRYDTGMFIEADISHRPRHRVNFQLHWRFYKIQDFISRSCIKPALKQNHSTLFNYYIKVFKCICAGALWKIYIHTYTYITRRIFPFRVSQHQSTDLHGATQTQPFRDYESDVLFVRLDTTWIEAYAYTKPHCHRSFCSPRGGYYRNPITNKILQHFAIDNNGPGSLL